MFKLNTPRLILRPLSSGDFAAVHSYASDPATVKYMTFGPNTEKDTQDYLELCEAEWKKDPAQKYDLAIILRGTGSLIGACGIYLTDSRREGMMGWVLHPDHRGRGHMPEAAGEILRFGFEELRLHRVWAVCYAPNRPSWRVMEKLGMRREGTHIKKALLRNAEPEAWCDEYHYAILEEEWKETHYAR